MKPSNSAMYEDSSGPYSLLRIKLWSLLWSFGFFMALLSNVDAGGKSLLLIPVILLACIKKCFTDAGSALVKFEGLALQGMRKRSEDIVEVMCPQIVRLFKQTINF